MKRLMLAAAMGVLAAATQAASLYIKPGVTDWTDPQNYWGTVTSISKGDTIIVSGNMYGATAATLEVPSDSYIMVTNLISQITFDAGWGDKGELKLTVAKTDGIDAYKMLMPIWSESGNGTLTKMGAGTLQLGLPKRNCTGIACSDYKVNFDIQAGAVKFYQECPADFNYDFHCGKLTMAEGTELWVPADGLTVNHTYHGIRFGSISGSGSITNQNAMTYNGARYMMVKGDSKFDGKIAGGISMYAYNCQLELTNDQNNFYSGDKGFVLNQANTGVKLPSLYRSTTETSAMGKSDFFRAQGTNTKVTYTGAGNETTKVGFNISNSPFTIDVGTSGGLVFAEGHECVGSYGGTTYPSPMQYAYLTGGSAENPTVFRPYLREVCDAIPGVTTRTNSTVHLTKKGSGTWRFELDKNSSNTKWTGGLIVEEGTAQFDTYYNVGTNCSFGYATKAQVPYQAPWDPAKNTPYSIALGGAGDTVGTLEYVGTNIINTTDRKIGLLGKGRIINPSMLGDMLEASVPTTGSQTYAKRGGPRRVQIGGVMAANAGAKELILDGTSDCQDTVNDIEDGTLGGTVSVTKRGTGSWTLGGNQTFSGKLKVENGKLYVHDGKHYSWFKWTVKQVAMAVSGGHYAYRAAEFALYDANGNRVNVGMTAPAFDWYLSDNDTAAAKKGTTPQHPHDGDASTDYTALAPNSAAVGRCEMQREKWPFSADVSSISGASSITLWKKYLGKMFDDKPAASENEIWVPFARGDLKLANVNNHISVFMHVKPGAVVSSYDWAIYAGNNSYNPTHWEMEGSVDGLTWESLDNKEDVDHASSVNNCWSYAHAQGTDVAVAEGQVRTGYPIATGPTGTAPTVLNNATVQVASGATLVIDGDITISKLAIDAASAGTIENAKFAATGAIDVTGSLGMGNKTLPGTYTNATGLDNLANWTLTCNGKGTSRKLTVADGKLTLVPAGTTISID